MGTNKRITRAIVSGLCFIAVCVFMLAIPSMYKAAEQSISLIELMILPVALFLYAVTLCFHINGYAELGRKYNSTILLRASQILAMGALFFGGTVISSIFAAIFGSVLELEIANVAIGLVITILVLPALLFTGALITRYKQFGLLAFPVVVLPPAAVIFIWQPWPVALLAAASVYLLYRESK